jgi:hypothetical protein
LARSFITSIDRSGGTEGNHLGRWRRATGHVAVHPLQGIGGVEGEAPGQELVEGDPQRVEIAALVEGPVGPAGLLGRHVGQRALDEADAGRLSLAGEGGGDLEVGDLHLARVGVQEDVLGLEILVDHVALVDVGHRGGDADGQAQETSRLHGRTQLIVQRHPPKSSITSAGMPW